MDEISLALNPPRFRKFKKPPIRIARSESPVFPLPAINGREPVVFEPTSKQARGIELAYARIGSSDAIRECPPGTQNGTETHLMPQMTPVFSIDGGEITFAGRLGHGYGIIVNHGNGYASHYAHLRALVAIRTDLYRPRAQYVRAGDVIGYVGAPEPGAFKRLYFELWERDRARHFVPIDPRPRLAECTLKREYDHFTPAPPVAQKEAA